MVSCCAMGNKSKRTKDLHKNEGLKHASKTGDSDSAPKVLDDNSMILNPLLHDLCDTGNSPPGLFDVAMPGSSFIPPEYSLFPGILDSLRYPE